MVGREEFAATYFKSEQERVLSLSHFNSQWLQFIRIIGCHPITYIRPAQKILGGNYLFNFQLFSWVTLYSAIFLSLTVIYFLNWINKMYFAGSIESIIDESCRNSFINPYADTYNGTGSCWSHNLDSMTKLCLESAIKFIPLSGLGYVISGFLSTPNLIKFLNGANEFENRIRTLFPEVVDVSLAHLHRYRNRVVLSNSLIFGIFIMSQIPSYYFARSASGNFLESTVFLALVLVSSIGFHGIFDDTKCLIILKIIEEYFQQVIINSSENFQQIIDGVNTCHPKKFGTQDIRNWRSLVHLARKQARIGVLTIQGSTISSLFGIHLILTTSIYLIYSMLFKELPDFIGSYSIGSLVYCSLLYTRLYLKALLAESIFRKENKLAETLRVFSDTPKFDTKFASYAAVQTAQVEMSFITDPIVSKPTECILDSSIVLKVGLLLGIFRNVSTYAVALIQLDSAQTNFANNEANTI